MASKPLRNGPCPCGSGRKFKVCCLPGRCPSPRFAFLPSPTPNGLPTAFGSAAPAPRKWNKVVFDSPLANGGRLHAVLLYSDAGLRLRPFRMGKILTLDLSDIHFRGPATVIRIQPTQVTAEVEAEVLWVVRFGHDDGLGTPLHGKWNPPPDFVERWRSRRREVVFKLEYPDGGWCDIRLLRTVKWIAESGSGVGTTIFLELDEVGTRGWAKVIEILPCGPVEVGPGDMVTGTFRHSHGQIGELVLESEPKPMGVTPGHLFWSEDRQAWVPVGSLRCRETLRTIKGLTRMVSYTLADRVEPVYNIEVEGSHCYRVGESGVLVHNMSAPAGSTCRNFADDELRSVVIDIHRGFQHFLAQTLRTTVIATLRDKDGNLIGVFSVSGGFQNAEVTHRAHQHGFTVYAPGTDHAEQNILAYAESDCLTPAAAIAPCRPACGPAQRDCDRAVRDSSARLVNPRPNSAGQTINACWCTPSGALLIPKMFSGKVSQNRTLCQNAASISLRQLTFRLC